MKKSKWIIAILTVSLLAGCYTTGLSPREAGPNRYSELVYGLCDQQGAMEDNSTPVQLPINLAVAQIGETTPPDELMNALREHQVLIKNIIPLPLAGDTPQYRYHHNNQQQASQTEQIRQQARIVVKLAKQMGADYVLVIGGNIDSTVDSTPIELLDIAIVPGFVVPSKTIEMTARAGGVLINTKTGQIRALLNASTHDKKSCPSAYVNQSRTELAVKQRGALSEKLVEQLVAKF